MNLHGFWRSSASYRVRIVLNLKGITVASRTYRLRRGEQRRPDYLALNPQGLVPALETGVGVLTQSLAICEWLDEQYPDPAILPQDAWTRARVRAFAQVIACDVHPIQNLRILTRLTVLGLDERQVNAWAREAICEGFDSCERLIAGEGGPFCFGATPTLADVCLIPQVANAERFGVELTRFPRLMAVNARCHDLAAFADAAPERQPDAERDMMATVSQ